MVVLDPAALHILIQTSLPASCIKAGLICLSLCCTRLPSKHRQRHPQMATPQDSQPCGLMVLAVQCSHVLLPSHAAELLLKRW